jgi:hypothetical protein
MLTPLSLALWIMDDVTAFKNKGLQIYTDSFAHAEVLLLIKVLKNKIWTWYYN